MRTKAFTMVEVLTVLAIIAILAALLFPVFTSAKARSKQSSCAENLHQQGLAYSIYAGDHDGEWLDSRYPALDEGTSLAEMDAVRRAEVKRQKAALAPYIKSEGIYRCAQDRYRNVFLVEDPSRTFYQVVGSSYFYVQPGSRVLPGLETSDPSRIYASGDYNWVHGRDQFSNATNVVFEDLHVALSRHFLELGCPPRN